jgi:hypothetical protein
MSGTNVNCECCGWNGKKFTNYNQYCPNCISQPRNRLLANELKKNRYKDVNSILIISPNLSEYTLINNLFAPKILDCIDRNPLKWVNIIQDITKPINTENLYDLIVCWSVLQYIEEDQKAVKNLMHVLKESGTLLFHVPIFPIHNKYTFQDRPKSNSLDRLTHYGHEQHVRGCGLDYGNRFLNISKSVECFNIDMLYNENTIKRNGLSYGDYYWTIQKS